MGYVQVVAQHELQRVSTGRKGDLGFRLSSAEMNELIGGRQRLDVVDVAGVIYQQMMMPGIGLVDPGWSYAHASQSKLHGKRRIDRCAVRWCEKIHHDVMISEVTGGSWGMCR